jgi:hypothetical protein
MNRAQAWSSLQRELGFTRLPDTDVRCSIEGLVLKSRTVIFLLQLRMLELAGRCPSFLPGKLALKTPDFLEFDTSDTDDYASLPQLAEEEALTEDHLLQYHLQVMVFDFVARREFFFLPTATVPPSLFLIKRTTLRDAKIIQITDDKQVQLDYPLRWNFEALADFQFSTYSPFEFESEVPAVAAVPVIDMETELFFQMVPLFSKGDKAAELIQNIFQRIRWNPFNAERLPSLFIQLFKNNGDIQTLSKASKNRQFEQLKSLVSSLGVQFWTENELRLQPQYYEKFEVVVQANFNPFIKF